MKEAAAVIERNKRQILEAWVKNVREELPAPRETVDPVLRDHLPPLLNDIILVMQRYDNFDADYEKASLKGMLQNSTGHGRHRSSSLGYNIEQVLREYIILHRLLTNVLRENNVYTTEVADSLKYIMENSMLYAAVSFQNSLVEIRQKLMGVLVHDVRNPISAAYLAVSMIDREDEPERFEKLKDMLKNSIKRSLDLIGGFLESFTVGAGEGITLHFNKGDLLEPIRSVHGEASAIYSNKVVLNCNDEPIEGVFDIAMIRRVLENIISNAVKYGEVAAPITIDVKTDRGTVEIGIHNYGDPIPENKQKEIFKFLNTTNASGPKRLKSWGMGLTLVNAVAEAHGGYLDLKSTEEDGTTFKLVIRKNSNKPGKVKTSVIFSYDTTHLESI